MMTSTARKHVTIVEIDLPQCVHVFGSAPCTAALSASVPRKCFNSRATCVDPANFSAGVQTVRFGPNISGVAKGQTIFPALADVSTSGVQINLSGIDPKSTALGRRAQAIVRLQDFTYHDGLMDKYRNERQTGAAQYSGIGYEPEKTGTFFGRLAARHPYYRGLSLRVKRGEIGQELGSMATEHYVITEWTGPGSDGVVTIEVRDILDLAEDEKALAPRPSNGKLLEAISETDAFCVLVPAGIGDQEYPASGRVAIGREVATFTRSGDLLTLVARGVDGSKAEGHKGGDLAQLCLRYEGVRVSDAAHDLLTNYTTTPASYIDLPEWHAEDDEWFAGVRLETTIAKPTGVKTLIGELCQLGVMIWPDITAQRIRFLVNRPLGPGVEPYKINDSANSLEGSVHFMSGDDKRISAVLFWHSMIDPIEGPKDGNFDKVAITGVAEDLYGQPAIKKIYTRWFGRNGNDGYSGIIADRLLGRYQETPKMVSVTLDKKDESGAGIGAVVELTTRLMQDAAGVDFPEVMQISSLDVHGDRIKITAETYNIAGRFGYLMQDPSPDYDAATDQEKAEGAFLMDDGVGSFPDGTGPYVLF